MRKLLLVSVSICFCLVAKTSDSQWLGTWKLRPGSLTPTDDPAHLAKESTVVFTERNGEIRRVETRTNFDGGKATFDSGFMKWDGQAHEMLNPPGTVVVKDIDFHHQMVIVKQSSGLQVIFHSTLAEDGKSQAVVEDVRLPDGKSKQYKCILDKE